MGWDGRYPRRPARPQRHSSPLQPHEAVLGAAGCGEPPARWANAAVPMAGPTQLTPLSLIADECSSANCLDEGGASLLPNRWTMPLLRLGEKRFYLGIFFKVSLAFLRPGSALQWPAAGGSAGRLPAQSTLPHQQHTLGRRGSFAQDSFNFRAESRKTLDAGWCQRKSAPCVDALQQRTKETPRHALVVPRFNSGALLQANWYRATQYCRYHGMHLASIGSQEENDKLEKHIRDYGRSIVIQRMRQTCSSRSYVDRENHFRFSNLTSRLEMI